MLNSATAATIIHPWERGGHLKAPFRLIGFSVRKYRACEGAPAQPGGTCFICGTGIMNVFSIRDANGFEFIVGCDCVEKVDAILHSECKATLKSHKREAKIAAYREARLAREASERTANLAEGRGKFTNAELRQQEHDANAQKRQAEIAAREAAREAERLASKHVGEIGKRVAIDLTCTFTFTCEPGPYGTTTIYGFQDSDKNAFVIKTTTSIGLEVETNGWKHWQGVHRGDTVSLKGTIKSHDMYKGCKQTRLARCKVLSIIAGEES